MSLPLPVATDRGPLSGAAGASRYHSKSTSAHGIGPYDMRLRRLRTAFRVLREARQFVGPAMCLRSTVGSVRDGSFSSGDGQAHVSALPLAGGGFRPVALGLARCRSRACPWCVVRDGERRCSELGTVFQRGTDRGMVVVMVTLTLAHQAGWALSETTRRYVEANQRLRSGRGWQAFSRRSFGCVAAEEHTVSSRNGWHPHRHELWFLPAGTDVRAWATEYSERYLAALERSGLSASVERGLHWTVASADVAAYVAKWGREPRWTPAAELTRSGSKLGGRTVVAGRLRSGGAAHYAPMQLLDLAEQGDGQARAWYLEYVAAVTGRAALYFSPRLLRALGLVRMTSKLRKKLEAEGHERGDLAEVGDLADAEAAYAPVAGRSDEVLAEAGESREVASFRLGLWWMMLDRGLVGVLFDAISRADWPTVGRICDGVLAWDTERREARGR